MMRALLTFLFSVLITMSSLAAGRHADPALEATLPQTLGGVALTIESQHGTDLNSNSTAFDSFLKELGKSREDFIVASAYASGSLKGAVSSWRVKGAASLSLLPAFKVAIQSSSNIKLTIAEETLSGRTVTRIGEPRQLAQGPIYVFVKNDILYFVQTSEPALAEEAISKLPAL